MSVFRFIRLLLPIACLLVVNSACTTLPIAKPFKVLAPDLQQEQFLVVITEAKLRQGAGKSFNRYVRDIEQSLLKQPGLYGYSIRAELLGNRAWTLTVWQDEQSMQQFKVSPEHLIAMQNVQSVLESAGFLKLQETYESIPLKWDFALRLLSEQGRFVKYQN